MGVEIVKPHVENAKNIALDSLSKPKTGGGLTGWIIRRGIKFLARKLRRSVNEEEIEKIAELLVYILKFLRASTWVKVKHHDWMETATGALQALSGAINGKVS